MLPASELEETLACRCFTCAVELANFAKMAERHTTGNVLQRVMKAKGEKWKN